MWNFRAITLNLNTSEGSRLTSLYNVNIAKQRLISIQTAVQGDEFYTFYEILADCLRPQRNIKFLCLSQKFCVGKNGTFPDFKIIPITSHGFMTDFELFTKFLFLLNRISRVSDNEFRPRDISRSRHRYNDAGQPRTLRASNPPGASNHPIRLASLCLCLKGEHYVYSEGGNTGYYAFNLFRTRDSN